LSIKPAPLTDNWNAGLTRQTVEEHLSRILASAEFRDASRMARFLRFIVEERLAGKAESLKETVIGVGVFDRAAGYDPRLDPIVRVEARRLRAKLAKYYAGPGAGDALWIDLPTGAYSPVFRDRREAAPERVRARIAVMPFRNLSGLASEDYFSDGLTEELIHALTKIEGLQVVAWSSVAKLRGQDEQVAEVGNRLGAGHILRGHVRKTADRVRITAQLIDTSTATYLWSESFDRVTSDIFRIQEDIAAAIATALQLRLSGNRTGSVTAHRLNSYNLYLKGRHQWGERTADALKRSIVYFEHAVAMDPTFAVAFAGLADAHTLLADYGIVAPSEALPKAKEAAERALELDPGCAEAYTSLALIRTLVEWRWEEAESLYRQAIKLKPSYAVAHHWYSIDYLAMLGRFEEAFAEMDVALDLDPLSGILREGRASLRTFARQYGEAVRLFQEALNLDPTFYKGYTSFGRTLILLGEYGKAIEMLERGRSLAGEVPNILAALGQAHALAGNRERALWFIEELERLSTFRYVPSTCYAVVCLGLGQHGKALDYLEASAGRRELTLSGLGIHPLWDPLRGEARFHALLDRIGLGFLR